MCVAQLACFVALRTQTRSELELKDTTCLKTFQKKTLYGSFFRNEGPDGLTPRDFSRCPSVLGLSCPAPWSDGKASNSHPFCARIVAINNFDVPLLLPNYFQMCQSGCKRV